MTSKYANKQEYYKAGNCRKRNIPYEVVEGVVVRLDKLSKKPRSINKPINNDIIAEVIESPDLIDTVGWKTERWMKQFQPDDILLRHQLDNQVAMDTYDHGMIRDPRQHGKTNFVIKPRLLRRLCETPFTGPKSLIYGSHSYGNSINMTMILKYNLIQNPAILKNYGMLIDYTTYKQSRLQKQTQHIINLVGQRKTSHSFQGISTGQGIRGTSGIDECYIDDPIDLEKEEEYEKATKKFLGWFKFKIMPFCRGGIIWLIGTRYGIKDLWVVLDEEKIYFVIERAALNHPIPPYTVNWPEEGPLRASHLELIDPDKWELMAPELWSMQTFAYNGSPAQNLAFEIQKLGPRAAQQELMNNPLPYNPLIKWEWFNQYQNLPLRGYYYRWAVMVDEGAGESAKSDYTAMVLVGLGGRENDFFVHDFIHGRWTGKEKVEQLERFVSHASEILTIDKYKVEIRDIQVLVETVYSQRDLFQRLRDESWISPRPVAPTKRGQKEWRITYGLGQELENSKVYLYESIRNKRQLHMEVDGFPNIDDDHALDALDQCIFALKTFKSKIKAGWL